ncbi:MAG: formylmethanofuran dehydrogenase subunit E family protein [Cyclobacteriaceae bacterium]|nr:formylmethanofuran dehydrogenase subunit E family protein [Cyclobacteriaceae bacterium]MCH8514826.1 formylmethanofuran dehydrogenase subunit E family protein [Cyclobacteriaceae bacterium]
MKSILFSVLIFSLTIGVTIAQNLNVLSEDAIANLKTIRVVDTEFSKGRLGHEQEIELADLVKLHGHLCDGLVVGWRALEKGMHALYADEPVDRTNTRLISKPSPCLADAGMYISGGRTAFGSFEVRNDFDGLYLIQRIDTQEAVSVSLNEGVKPAIIDEMGSQAVNQELNPCDLQKLRALEDDFSNYLLEEDSNFFTVKHLPLKWT